MNAYLEKYGYCNPQINKGVAENLGLCIVIPCYNEPDILKPLNSLNKCSIPNCDVEVYVVVNASENETHDILNINQKSLLEADLFEFSSKKVQVHAINAKELPKKHAGVGLARKIGMDEAVYRFQFSNNRQQIIVNLDADCEVDENYLVAIEEHFKTNAKSPGANVYFKHPLDNEGILNYELYLRYYVNALKSVGYPYSYHTIGSCFAVRNKVYQAQGGMNKRKVSEDFYFLQKIIPLGNYTEVLNTTVKPSSRAEVRAPYGTGKAVVTYKTEQQFITFQPAGFYCLKSLFNAIKQIYEGVVLQKLQLAPILVSFLEKENFAKKIVEINSNTTDILGFTKRFYNWFGGLKCLQFLNTCDEVFPRKPVLDVANEFAIAQGYIKTYQPDLKALLLMYRAIDKKRR